MKVNIILLSMLCASLPLRAELKPYIIGDIKADRFVFVENNADDNFFVTPAAGLNPRMTGANKWTGLKYGGTGDRYQQSLGYIDDGENRGLNHNWYYDMWLEKSPFQNPLTGLRCLNFFKGCDMDTSLILPQITDELGFYGAIVTPGDSKWSHGMMSESYYQHLKQVAPGESFSMEINTCQTPDAYDATAGGRCKDQNNGNWYKRKVTHTKGAHLRFINTNYVSEIFINSDGVPVIGEGNAGCKNLKLNSRSGIMCKMVNYNVETDGSLRNDSIHIFPSINHPGLTQKVSAEDLQFSLNGNQWKVTAGTGSYYTFNELTASNEIYVFFSSNFFKQMLALGITEKGSRDLINFRFQNTTSPESGWYEFSTSNELHIKARDFGINIISDEFEINPHREGLVGPGQKPLDFGYIITTSGKTGADLVKVKATGPTRVIDGINYCIFSSEDKSINVPFPASLNFTNRDKEPESFNTGCDGKWYDMTNALWTSKPWDDGTGDIGELDRTKLNFRIPMDNEISFKDVNGNIWLGDVSASGEIHVEATWRDR